ncbi:MAG TPA: Fur family transcriptional regulator [Desulfobacterales bacterium]|nr:Fur family transcriptional regulator [Desulfobacterales bacterium]
MKFSLLSFFRQGRKNSGPDDIPAEHRHDREQFQEALQSFQATRVEDRLRVLDLFLSEERHVTLADLMEIIADRCPDLLDQAFLQETMNMFCQFGFAQRRNFENKDTLYEHLHLGRHHDHLICTKCGMIQEFHDHILEERQLAIAEEFNFHPLQHKTEIYGLCDQCLSHRQPSLPLYMAAAGERVQITNIIGGREVKRRLTGMGLTMGADIEIISSNPSGPLVVVVNGTRLALGIGVAGKVMVTHASRHEKHEKHEKCEKRETQNYPDGD